VVNSPSTNLKVKIMGLFEGMKIEGKSALGAILETAKKEKEISKKFTPHWALTGEAKSAKSVTALKGAFLNLKFADKEWFPAGVKDLLKRGEIPEVTQVIAMDTEFEMNQRIFKVPITRDIFKPVRDIIHVVPVTVRGARNRYSPEKSREFMETVVTACIDEAKDKKDDGIMIVFDSLTDYSRALNQTLRRLHGKEIILTMRPGEEAGKNIFRPFYAWRNNEWEATVKDLRDFPGLVISTIKGARRWMKLSSGAQGPSPNPEDVYPKIAPDSEFWFHEFVWFFKEFDENVERVRFKFQISKGGEKQGTSLLPREFEGDLTPLKDRGTFLQLYDLLTDNFKESEE